MGYFSISSLFSSRKQEVDDEESTTHSWSPTPEPSPRIAQGPRHISPPIPRTTATSLTGFDNPYLAGTPPGSTNELWQFRQQHNASLTRLASSSQSNVFDVYGANRSKPRLLVPDDPVEGSSTDVPPPAVIRIETSPDPPQISTIQSVRRTVSSPPTSPYHPSPTSSISSAEITPTAFAAPSIASQSGRWVPKVQTDLALAESTHSLPNHIPPADRTPPAVNTDVYGCAYSYPLAKQLSPIAEQDYFSPDSLQRTQSLPASVNSQTGDMAFSASVTSASPGGSNTSELTRPSPSYSSPFLTRQLNRTASQGSSRTHVSSTSTTLPRLSAKSGDVPSIPPLDLRPPFPGPHPSPTGPRPVRTYIGSMPVISGSDEEYEYAATTESLHAESFVTATSGRPRHPTSIREVEIMDDSVTVNVQESCSIQSHKPSASESFITRRWDRDVALGTGVRTFRAKKQYISATPAFWTFWFGFIFPVLWLVGGWHFTNFGEQPPRLTFWEFYFNAGYWKEMCCGKRNKKREMERERREGKKPKVAPPPLPRWVAEKQRSEDGRARLNDPKRSLKGISFGYPFIPRVQGPVNKEKTWGACILGILGKPNRIFDQLYGVKLREVRGRPESRRRCFDPWIQRCRYALCYAMFFIAIGLCVASAYLIVYNTRQLH